MPYELNYTLTRSLCAALLFNRLFFCRLFSRFLCHFSGYPARCLFATQQKMAGVFCCNPRAAASGDCCMQSEEFIVCNSGILVAETPRGVSPQFQLPFPIYSDTIPHLTLLPVQKDTISPRFTVVGVMEWDTTENLKMCSGVVQTDRKLL